MRCRCGFDNDTAARFCRTCGLPLSEGAASDRNPDPARRRIRSRSRMTLPILAAVVLIGAPGYWWLSQPPGAYKSDNGGLYRITIDGKHGYMNREGETVIEAQFDAAGDFSEGLAPVRVGSKIGYIDSKGAIAISPQFDADGPSLDAFAFRYGRARVRVGEGYGFIGKDGKYIRLPNLLSADWFSGGLATVRTAENKLAYLDRSGEIAATGAFDNAGSFTDGYAPASSNGKWGFIDDSGRWLIEPQFDWAGNFGDGPAPVLISGKFGYINQRGKFVINPHYDGGRQFSEDYAAVRSDAGWGFIDAEGRVLANAWFEDVSDFSEGLAAVKTSDGWGYVDRSGRTTIEARFDSAFPFQNGLGRVRIGRQYAYLTPGGDFVVDPFPGRARLSEDAPPPSNAAFKAEGRIRSVAISPDGRTVAAGQSDTTVSVWAVKGGGLTQELTRVPQARHDWQTGITSLAYSHDSRILATGGEDGVIVLWDMHTGKQTTVLTGHSDPVNALAFGNGDRLLASGAGGSTDYTMRIWDVASASQLAVRNLNGIVYHVAFNADGSLVAASAWDNVHVFRLPEVQPVAVIPAGSRHVPAGAALFVDDDRVVISGGDQKMHAYSLEAGAYSWTGQRDDWEGPPIAWCSSSAAIAAFVNTSTEPLTIQTWQFTQDRPVARVRVRPKRTTSFMTLGLSSDCRYASVVHEGAHDFELLVVPPAGGGT